MPTPASSICTQPGPGGKLDAAVQPALRFQIGHQPLVDRQDGYRELPLDAEQYVLQVVVPQYGLRHLVRGRLEDLVALGVVDTSRGYPPVEEDLDVHLVVGGVHAGRVVDGVGVHVPAGPGELDTAQLGTAEVAALADHAATELGGVGTDAVVGLVTDVDVALRRRLDVGADAAVPEQVHWSNENCMQEVVWRQRLGVRRQTQPLRHLR
jgi:hypothetical protein